MIDYLLAFLESIKVELVMVILPTEINVVALSQMLRQHVKIAP